MHISHMGDLSTTAWAARVLRIGHEARKRPADKIKEKGVLKTKALSAVSKRVTSKAWDFWPDL